MSKYKLMLITLFLLATTLGLRAQNPDWLWARNAGINVFGVTHGVATAVDNTANVYITGTFYGTASFGATTLTSMGNGDMFIAKLDANGNWLWAKNTGGSARGYGITLDNMSNVYVTGCFGGTGSFGSLVLNSSGNNDVFAAKLDTNGNWLWVKSAGGVDPDYGWSIAVDNAANVYLTGHFWYTATFGSTTLTSTSISDIFIAKLDNSGNWLWAKQCGGGVYGDYPLSIDVDNSANVYVTGCFEGTTAFGTTSLASLGYADVFVAKLNTNGTWLWVKQAGGANGDYAYGVAVDANSNLYLTGYYWYTSTFGSTTLTSSYSSDTFVAKLDSSGNWLWARNTVGISCGFGIAVDGASNVYITGEFWFSDAFGSTTLTCTGSSDIFAAKMDANGNWVWAKRAGGASNDWVDTGYGIAVDSAANVYISGYFAGTAGFGNVSLTGDSYWWELFVAKLGTAVAVQDDLMPQASAPSRLYEAYPNPFRNGENTLIQAEIAKGETGLLQIFNLRGQSIASHQLKPGTHQVSLDSTELPSGVYLYQLKTESVSEVKRLILLK